MNAYQHYSFDLWLTLIKSNPVFKQQRSRYFHKRFNMFNKPLEEVERIFRKIDLMVNNINETTGKNIDADEMYLIVIAMINDNKMCLQEIDVPTLYFEMETLLLEYPPIVYNDRTLTVLDYLKQNYQCSMSLLSNTGFVKGATLRKVLKLLGLDSYFDFQLYSDEAGLSKPNVDFFQLMINKVASMKTITLDQIIHIGDNPKADIWGAEMAGINCLLINSNNQSILNLTANVTKGIFTA